MDEKDEPFPQRKRAVRTGNAARRRFRGPDDPLTYLSPEIAGDPPQAAPTKKAARIAREIVDDPLQPRSVRPGRLYGVGQTAVERLVFEVVEKKQLPSVDRRHRAAKAKGALLRRYIVADTTLRLRLVAFWWWVVNQEPPQQPAPVANPPPKPRPKAK